MILRPTNDEVPLDFPNPSGNPSGPFKTTASNPDRIISLSDAAVVACDPAVSIIVEADSVVEAVELEDAVVVSVV